MIVDKVLRYIPKDNKDQLRPIAAVIPVVLRQGTTYWQWRHFLRIAEKWPLSRIEAWQLKRLKSIVRYAYENIEGYYRLYKQAGVSPKDIHTLQDIRQLPFTTKQLFQDDLEAFSVKCLSRRYTTTGGSTGIPFGFYISRKNNAIEDAFMHTAWTGVKWQLGARNAVLRGRFVGSEANPVKYDPYRRELNLSSYYLTEKTLSSYISALKRYQPKILQAYPSSLSHFCNLLRQVGMVEHVHFDLILLGSENIYDWQLARFNQVFPGARLFSWYGHAEKAILAPWCEHERTYHLWPFYGYTEVLGNNDQEVEEGEEGELVGTSFHNFITPFIRYRTMDLAIKGGSSCSSCNRPFRLLERISGRIRDVIITGTGRYVPAAADMHDSIFDGIRQFQFIQEVPGKVVFKYIPKKEFVGPDLENMRSRLLAKLGGDVQLSVIPVKTIPRTKAGKFLFLDQRLSIKHR